MRIHALVDSDTTLRDLPAYVRLTEQLGFDGLEIPETRHDALLGCVLAAEHSTTLTIGTSVALAFPRSPMTVAVAAWDLQALSGGRLRLGLGTQIRANIEGRFAVAWTDPVSRMRDYVTSLRAIWRAFQDGTSLRSETGNYSFTRLQPLFNPGPIEHPHVPIVLGGVGAEMCELAGQVADGLVTHPTNSTPEYLRSLVLPHLSTGATAAGRDPTSIELSAVVQTITGRDRAELDASREAARPVLAGVLSTPAYRWTLRSWGRENLAVSLRALSREGRWAEMAALVDDDVIDRMAVVATYPDLAAALLERYSGLVDTVAVMLPLHRCDPDGVRRVVSAVQAGRSTLA
ncbi:MAG TPA: TIGR03617 family F420-dependent LLM class oxidoreductase [Pseudonocardia sp.]|jgi:probable F420-dependent oxidoreductase